jgi:hypothetical protein
MRQKPESEAAQELREMEVDVGEAQGIEPKNL